MKKGGFWKIVLGVFAAVLVADLALLAFRGYMVNRAIDDMTQAVKSVSASSSTQIQRLNQQRELQQALRQRDELERNTLCAMNVDSGKCVCLHRDTGRRIPLTHAQCVSRASQASLR
jgi:hypothetical protein